MAAASMDITNLLNSIKSKITNPSQLYSGPDCSIFKIPDSFIAVNGENLYHPDIVSIGPIHHGSPHLAKMQEHKYLYLSQLLWRLGHLEPQIIVQSVLGLEVRARECYSVRFEDIGRDEFVEMMVVDGCFVIELFRKTTQMVRWEADDPIVSQRWIFWSLLRDLLRLENQLPFFVLEELFSATASDEEKQDGVTLTALCLDFFANAFKGLVGVGVTDLKLVCSLIWPLLKLQSPVRYSWEMWLRWFRKISAGKTELSKRRRKILHGALVYEICSERNRRIFRSEAHPAQDIAKRISEELISSCWCCVLQ
ncbi:hypothetical protein Droror1_Dr00013842 [Drosera rotundifolia]